MDLHTDALLVDEYLADQVWELCGMRVLLMTRWLLAIKYQDAESIAEVQFDRELKHLLAQSGLAIVAID